MIDDEAAQKILDKYNLGKLTSLERQGTGITQSVFDINNKYILKLQQDRTDENRSERNAFVCRLLKKNKIKAPLLIVLNTSKDIVPDKYILTTRLEGENLRDVWRNLPEDEQRRIFFEYGRLMARFHQIPMKKFGDPVSEELFDNWHDCIASRYNDHFSFSSKNRLLPQETLRRIGRFFKEKKELLHVKTKPVLVHNDFQSKNIKYHDGKFNGIFDFDECLGAHNEFDFIKTMLPFKREKVWLDEILKGYKTKGSLSKQFPERVRLYELNFCLKMFKFAFSNKLMTSIIKNKFLWAIDKIIQEEWRYFDFPSEEWK